ncbi:type VII secretion protein [Streptococcus plurextorum]|uniref:type VII secretion protein n=1 Tax=Streptococcus plurextorum TaxID=456876 RepID=UPI00048667B7|nr:type VII secretion protein [Streptococcus plurextorum]
MEDYINISLDCSPYLGEELDLRVPTSMTLRELLIIVSDSYGLSLDIENPSARNKQTGAIITSTSRLVHLKDGALLALENI